MKRWLLFVGILLTVTAGSLVPRGGNSLWCILWGVDCGVDRVASPMEPIDYTLPRTVGAWSQYHDMQQGPIGGWSLTPGRPFWQTLHRMRRIHGLNAAGFALRAHPTDNSQNWEDVHAAFRMDGIDIIVLWLQHWTATGEKCGEPGLYYEWQTYPDSIFMDLYKHYWREDKAIILLTYETSNRITGKWCDERDQCVGGNIDECVETCEETGDVGYTTDEIPPGTCLERCCDVNKLERMYFLLGQWNRRQKALMAARAAYPRARLKVFLAIEEDVYGLRDEPIIATRDIVPMMDSLDGVMIGASLWPNKSGDPVEAFNKIRTWTGLPAHRIFIAEVGARERNVGDQYDRIRGVVAPLFNLGSPFALVWSLEQSHNHTTHALIDPETGEYRSGMRAIVELNKEYGHD